MKVLVTGGAGFIGTHVVSRLLSAGAEVTVLDNFSPQIHGDLASLRADIAPHVRLVVADIRDQEKLATSVKGQDAIVHLAAETGTGQSMYEVVRYESVNIGGTACLMEAIAQDPARQLRRLVVASSRAVYGEGCYLSPSSGVIFPESRNPDDMRAGRFDPLDPKTGQACSPLPTPEEAPLQPSSIYGLTKQVQEQLCLLWAKTLGFSALALRYQNVFGPGQSLKNPYTGILAIFSNQARLNRPIYVFEDGKESRDFVYIEDVAAATVAAVFHEGTEITAINIGSGHGTTVLALVDEIVTFFHSSSPVSVTGAFRQGDIRHCFADLTRAKALLGFAPRCSFRDGLRQFLEWASTQEASESGYATSLREMREKGLLHE